MADAATPLASIARRLLWVTGLGSLLMALAVTAAAVLTVDAEVDELLDDGLKASAAQLSALLLASGGASPLSSSPPSPPSAPGDAADDELRFAWAWFDGAGRLLRASAGSEPIRWQPARAGFADRDHWRLYGAPGGAADGLRRGPHRPARAGRAAGCAGPRGAAARA
ncbi:MAG: hypothetical protein EOP35_23575 [Rubrivivax sp.]|nr:MAG: hypothetical protein EOP35_23575 [Rubrivivax sp.]